MSVEGLFSIPFSFSLVFSSEPNKRKFYFPPYCSLSLFSPQPNGLIIHPPHRDFMYEDSEPNKTKKLVKQPKVFLRENQELSKRQTANQELSKSLES